MEQQMTEPREREMKFALTGDLPAIDVAGYTVHDTGTQTLDAVYFDTDALELSAQRFSVRRRIGVGWTFKGPSHDEGGAQVREEREWPDQDDFPAELMARVQEAAGDLRLLPVARLRSVRRTLKIADADGAHVAEIDDDVVDILDGDVVMETFREVEIELKESPDAQAVAEAVAQILLAAGATSHTESKYGRALRVLGRRP